jgi:hypothetical protein
LTLLKKGEDSDGNEIWTFHEGHEEAGWTRKKEHEGVRQESGCKTRFRQEDSLEGRPETEGRRGRT